MKRVLIGDTEIVATAIPHDSGGFVSAVTVVRHPNSERGRTTDHLEWPEPLFESEAEALRFAWRRAVLMSHTMSSSGGEF
jgi:hypothetical protein